MKIGFIGNTNNYPFMLAVAMQQAGHDVIFVVDQINKLHRPEYMYDAETRSRITVKELENLPVRIFQTFIPASSPAREAVNILKECDALVVNGSWVTVARRVGKPYLVLVTGSDLEVYADDLAIRQMCLRYLSAFRKVAISIAGLLISGFLAQRQREAISASCAYNYFPPGLIPNGERILRELPSLGAKRLCFMMTDVRRTAPQPPPSHDTPRILLAARMNWVLPIRPGMVDLDYKGTDIFLRGLALYRQRGGSPWQVVLVRKGLDVEAAADLVRELNLSDWVVWREEMSQVELYMEYVQSDVIADQFARGVVGMAGLDAMAMGRPLLANGRPEIFEPLIGEPSPICQAQTPEEVAAQLRRLNDPAVRAAIGADSRRYVQKHFSTDSAARICLDVFQEALATRKTAQCRESPRGA